MNNPRPKKRLGQNFLIDKNIRVKIAAACDLSASDTVLEIGAGKGEITGLLAAKAGLVYALEIDPSLCEILKAGLSELHNIEILKADVLKFDLNGFFKKLSGKVKVVGNIPYYITTPIIERLIEHRDKISSAFIMVQKEFALRAASVPGSKSFGSLSCFIQYYTSPKILFPISKSCFYPAPKIDSSFLQLEMRGEPAVKVNDEELFLKIIHSGFGQRRKTLRNSLKGIIPQQKLEAFFEKYGIDKNIRPERMSLPDFANLANLVNTLNGDA
ncbi:MAG: 16S rRNA (adenine(1518)-N(6)/adenine(1519)-N(6))-dimethyltransferase RsmA [Candidatus Omnitrophota bacterium]